MTENLTFSVWPKDPISHPEKGHCHKTVWYAMNHVRNMMEESQE